MFFSEDIGKGNHLTPVSESALRSYIFAVLLGYRASLVILSSLAVLSRETNTQEPISAFISNYIHK